MEAATDVRKESGEVTVFHGRTWRNFLEAAAATSVMLVAVGSLATPHEAGERVSHDTDKRPPASASSSAPDPSRPVALEDAQRPDDRASMEPGEKDENGVPSAAPAAPRPQLPAACDGPVRLTGSVVVAGQPEHSMAALSQGRGTALLRIGESIAGLQLVALRERRAFMREPSGAYCTLYLLPATAGAGAQHARRASQPRVRSSAREGGRIADEELGAAIRAVGRDRYVVSRAFATQALSRLVGARGMGRVRPAVRNGRPEGLRVSKIREGSPLARLGIRNGDVLRALNGISLAGPDGLMSAYPLLKQQPRLSLAILRKGHAKTLEYTLE